MKYLVFPTLKKHISKERALIKASMSSLDKQQPMVSDVCREKMIVSVIFLLIKHAR